MQRVALAGQWGAGPARMIIAGGVCGLAWTAGLRGFMAVFAGSASGVEWAGTFGWILLPGVVVGGLLGRAEHLRRNGGRQGWRWLALAPLLFASVVFRAPGALLEDGIGGGAIAVALLGMAAGYAWSGRGPTWGRPISGGIALAPAPIWVLYSVGDPSMAVTSPHGAWLAVYFFSFLAVLGLGCSIPHRPLPLPDGARALVMTREATRPPSEPPSPRPCTRRSDQGDMAMTTVNRTSESSPTHHDDERGDRRSRVGWHRLQTAAAWAAIASFTVPMIIDRTIVGFLVAMLAPFMIGLLLRIRWPRVGAIWIGIVSLAELLFSMPFLAEALTHPETRPDFMPLVTLTLAILVGSVAAIPAFRQGRRPDLPSRSATIVAATAILVLVVAVTVSVVATAGVDSTPAQAGDIQLTTTDFRFSPNPVTTADGTIAIAVTNDDTTRHTFTIDELDVETRRRPEPAAWHHTTGHLTADAGTYRFYCRPHVPGMAGSLVVQ